MSAFRQRAAGVARRTRLNVPRNSRSYASESHGHDHGHDHHHAAPVAESLGTHFYVTIGAIASSILVYSISRPGKDGEDSSITKLINSFSSSKEELETRNAVRAAAYEQAAHDKHLLYYAGRNKHIELKYPEVFQHGSPINVPAGHYINLEKVTDHYRQKHHEEEERKASKLAAASKEQ